MSERIQCQQCNRFTNHEVKATYNHHYDRDTYNELEIDFYNIQYDILICLGCDDVTVRQVKTNSEDREEEMIDFFPKRGLIEKYYKNLPTKLQKLYEEIIESFNNGSYLLAGAGVRALIEGICVNNQIKAGDVEYQDKNGKRKTKRSSTLEGKIEGLHQNSLLTQKNAELLHEQRFIGNEAVHQLEYPLKEELALSIEIVEHTIENIYELGIKGKKLKTIRKNRLAKKTN